MQGPALLGVGELFMVRPGIRHRLGEGDHLLHDGNLVFHCLARCARQRRGLVAQRLQQRVALLGHQFDAVGREQLVVADRRRDRPRARAAIARLHVVVAVAAGLEGIDPHRLLLGQAGRGGDARIGAFEIDLVGGPLRRELEVVRRGLNQIRHHRDRLARWPFGRRRIDRPLRPGIDRWLGQHVVVERDLLTGAPLGIAAAPLLGDRIPVGFEGRLCLLPLLQLAAIFGHGLWRDLRRGLRHGAGHGVRKRGQFGRGDLRRSGKERERGKTEANHLQWHGPVLPSTAPKSA
ncbi:hypothetical protein ES707_11289 [subsurface metagenome]